MPSRAGSTDKAGPFVDFGPAPRRHSTLDAVICAESVWRTEAQKRNNPPEGRVAHPAGAGVVVCLATTILPENLMPRQVESERFRQVRSYVGKPHDP